LTIEPLQGSAATNLIKISSSVIRSTLFGIAILLLSGNAVASPSEAKGYQPKYPPGFSHFSYVNPDAPKGGELTLFGFGHWDSFNPYLLRGVPVDGLSGLVFEPLMVQSLDEPYSLYAHIASDIELAPDHLSVTFTIDPKARFSNGREVTAGDVKYSFDTLKSDKAHPYYRFYWADITRAQVLSKKRVRFYFARVNPELHLIIAQMPVFAPEWAGDTPFDKLSKNLPIGTGPYQVRKYEFSKFITYERRKDYWAKGKNTARGMYNFDKITIKYYKDLGVQLEALKAGEVQFVLENNSKSWARDYNGQKFDDGRIIKSNLVHHNNAGMQGFVFNTRRELFKDVRVRRALTLAFDFAWSNKNLFYNQYVRCDSYFSNSDMASHGLPTGGELRILNRYRKQLPAGIFTQAWAPPSTDHPGELRRNLIKARDLLAEAGWTVKNGVLTNKEGKVFEFNFLLAQKGFERILAPYAHNLRKLGIIMHYRTVDVSLYVKRQRTYDFDMMVTSYGQSQSPGNELFNYWSSRAAEQEGTQNLPGIHDPVVDALINDVVYAPTRKDLVAAARALDRVLLWGEYLVPNWYINTHRVAYWNIFGYPKTLPLYYDATTWAMTSWWQKPLTESKP